MPDPNPPTPSPESIHPPGRVEWIIVSLLLAGASLGVFYNALGNPFINDDRFAITNNKRVTEGRYGEILTSSYWDDDTEDKLYRPVTSLTYAVNWALTPDNGQANQARPGENKAVYFRIVNLLLHVGVAILCYLIGRSVFRNRWAGMAAGLLVAVHPLHTEPLNTIVGRADILSCFLMFLAAWLYWRDGDVVGAMLASADGRADDAETTAAPRTATRLGSCWRPLLAAICFLLATLSKESGLTLVGVVALLDWWRWQDADWLTPRVWFSHRLVRCYAPMLVLVIAYLVLRALVLGQLTSGSDIKWYLNPVNMPADHLGAGDSPLLVRWMTPLVVYAKAAKLMFWPVPLYHDYSYNAIPPVRQWADPRMLSVLLALIGTAVMLLIGVASRWWRAVALAVGIVLAQYAIVSNLPVVIGTVFGDRLLYAPSIGVCLLIGWLVGQGVRQLSSAARRNLSLRGTVGVLALLAFLPLLLWYGKLTIDRNKDWASAENLLLSVPTESGQVSFKVLNNLAELTLRQADAAPIPQRANLYARAIRYAEQAETLVPESWTAYERLGVIHFHEGHYNQAVYWLEEAMKRGAQDAPRALEILARSYAFANRLDDAISMQEHLLEVMPDFALGHANLADFLMQQLPQDRDEARAIKLAKKGVELAIENDLPDPRVYAMLARVQWEAAQPEAARQTLKDALDHVSLDALRKGVRLTSNSQAVRTIFQRYLDELSPE